MAITTAASPGIEIQTAAKTTRLTKTTNGSASTLGSQASAASNQVIVPNGISTNNEGNLEASPSYVGRHFILRPLADIQIGGGVAVSAVVGAGGSGYAVNDKLTISGGTFRNAAVFNVDSVSSGAVVSVSLDTSSSHGNYTVTPSNPAATTTGGSGTGCTLIVTYETGEEIRFITADSSNTLTVNQDWNRPPVSGEDWAVSYILEDVATVTGLTLRTNSGIYEASRVINVGDTTHTFANFSCFGMADGKALETTDNGFSPSFSVQGGGLWLVGFEQGGESVNGAYVFAIEGTLAERNVGITNQGRYKIHALQHRSAFENLEWFAPSFLQWEGDNRLISGSKFFRTMNDFQATAAKIRDCVFTSDTPNGNENYISISDKSDIDGIIVTNSLGFRGTVGDTHNIKNITFASNNRHVIADAANMQFNFINPQGWIATSGFILLQNTTSIVRKKFDLDITVLLTDLTPVSNAFTFVYEGGHDHLPSINQQITDSNGRVVSDIMEESYTGPPFAVETFSDFAYQVFSYGLRPFVKNITLDQGLVETLFMLPDAAIVTSDQNQALNDGSGISIRRQFRIPFGSQTANFTVGEYCKIQEDNEFFSGLIVHNEDLGSTGRLTVDKYVTQKAPSTGSLIEDFNGGSADVSSAGSGIPFNLIHFDNGTGSPTPVVGNLVSGGTSGASGIIVEIVGTASDGFLLIGQRNDAEWSNNETLTTNVAGNWQSSADISGDSSSTNLDFTWLVDANNASNKSLTDIYEYLSAKMPKRISPILIVDDVSEPNPINYTTEASNFARSQVVGEETGAIPDVILTGAVPAPQDSVYFGADFIFEQITIVMDSVGTAIAAAWEYWNGSSWVALADVVDNTSSFSVLGTCPIDYTLPTNWSKTTVNNINAYWIRWRVTSSATGVRRASRVFIDRIIEGVHKWMQGEVAQMLFSGPDGFFTRRNPDLAQGVYIANRGAGTVNFFTSDDGTTFTPPTQFTLTLTELKSGSEVRIYNNVGGKAVGERAGTESSSTTFSHNYTHSGADIPVIIVIFHIDWKPIRLFLDLTASNQTIPITQFVDRIYENP